MELRHLRYFCAVAEDMHVTRAAERLRVAQPALTQQVKALEAELGVKLLRRVGRGVELTEAGRAFWREAQAILEQVAAAASIAQQTARGLAGRLTVGLTETASFAAPVTAVLKEARERWPQVELSLVQERSNDLVPALVARRIDVAFMRSPAPQVEALQWRPFLTEGLVAVIPDTHPLAAARSIGIAALRSEAIILPRGRRGDAALRTQLDAAFARAGHEARVVQETPQYIMAINLAAAGIGLALVPAVLTGLRRDGVVYRPLHCQPPLVTEIIVVSRTGDPAPAVGNFLALATELAPGSLQVSQGQPGVEPA